LFSAEAIEIFRVHELAPCTLSHCQLSASVLKCVLTLPHLLLVGHAVNVSGLESFSDYFSQYSLGEYSDLVSI
jgi:hypothetical protein